VLDMSIDLLACALICAVVAIFGGKEKEKKR
jgi:hypothetical protein